MVRKLACALSVVAILVAFQNCGGHMSSVAENSSSSVDASTPVADQGAPNGSGVADGSSGGTTMPPVTNPPNTGGGGMSTPAVFVIPTTAIADLAFPQVNADGYTYTCPTGTTGISINSVYGWSRNQEFCERPYASTDTQIIKDVKIQPENPNCPAGYVAKATVVFDGYVGTVGRKSTMCIQYQPVATAKSAVVRIRSTQFAALWANNVATAACQTGETEIGRKVYGSTNWPICQTTREIGLPKQVLGNLIFGTARKCPAGSEVAVELLAYGGVGGNDICATLVAPVAATPVIVDIKVIDKTEACAAGYDALPFQHPLLTANDAQIACVKRMAASAATQAVTRFYWGIGGGCQPGHLKAGGIKHPLFNGGSAPSGVTRFDSCIAY